jgi:hypothetical protein
VHRSGVGLVEDGADWGGPVRLRGVGQLGQQGAQVMAAATLPGRAGQRRADGPTSPWWASAVISWTPESPRATQAAPKGQPAGAVFGRGDL